MLHDWFTRLPEQACLFTLSVGNGRKLEQIFRVVTSKGIENGYQPKPNDKNETFQAENLDDVLDQIENVLNDSGFGYEYEKARIFAYSFDGKHLNSKLIRKDNNKEQTGEVSAITALAQNNIAMSNEVRRTLAIVTDSNVRLLELISSMAEGFVEAKREQVQSESEKLAYEMVLENAMHEDDNSVKEQGLNVLNTIAQTLMGKGIDAETIKDTIKNDPGVVDSFVDDDEVVNAVMQAIYRKKNVEE